MIMNTVNIDVFKHKSIVAVIRANGQLSIRPLEVSHLSTGIQINQSRPVIPCFNHYHKYLTREFTIDEFFMNAINRKFIYNYQDDNNTHFDGSAHPNSNKNDITLKNTSSAAQNMKEN